MGLLWQIFAAFARVGIFGYGGGPSMIPLMQREVVSGQGWLTEPEFVDALALGNSLPGPIAIKMSAYTGYKLAGMLGAATGILGTILPSTIAMLLLAVAYLRFKDLPLVEAALRGIRPAVVALLFWVAYDLFSQGVASLETAAIGIAVFAAVAFLDLHPAIAILGAGTIGLVAFAR